MTQSRRDATLSVVVDATTNASLWLDKYYNETEDTRDTEKKPKNRLVDEIAKEIQAPENYPAFFDRWKQNLLQLGAVCREVQVEGRLAINLGAEAVLETSIALHHTYGVPYIPGSALKGLASHFAQNNLESADWGRASPAYEVLFGNTQTAGYITFFDALYIPGSGHQKKALWADVTTVHHPDYYQAGEKPPADWDDLDPIPFLSATGRYLIALAGPSDKPEWVEKTYEILGFALEDMGIGAKTNSGYGRMSFVSPTAAGVATPVSEKVEESYALKKQRLLHEKPSKGRFRGTVVSVHPEGRIGTINPAGGGAPIPVHISQFKGEQPILRKGQVVEFAIGPYKGKDQAQDVLILLWPDR